MVTHVFRHGRVKHSTITEDGGHLLCAAGTVVISGKSSINGAFSHGSIFAGSLDLYGGTVTIEKSTITEVSGNECCAGIYASNGTAVTLIGATVTKNGAAGTLGGGFNLTEGASLKTTHKSKVTENIAEHGGGVFLTKTAGTVTEEKAGEISGNTPDNLYTEP